MEPKCDMNVRTWVKLIPPHTPSNRGIKTTTVLDIGTI